LGKLAKRICIDHSLAFSRINPLEPASEFHDASVKALIRYLSTRHFGKGNATQEDEVRADATVWVVCEQFREAQYSSV
jgi:hypothetical protein